jgi:hypothetical protein
MLNLPVRARLYFLVLCLTALLSACGGGASTSSTVISGIGAVGFPQSVASLRDPNVVAISVESGPGNNVNIPYVSVTVCKPGTSTCKTIDHILLDTGSTGLRIFASVLNATPALTLPPQQVGSSSTITECAQFLNAVAWGSVKLADVRLGGETAASVPVQLLDPNLPTALRRTCLSSSGTIMTQPSSVGANGILGLSLFSSDKQRYFDCVSPNDGCAIAIASDLQVQNPVALFNSDSNGVSDNNGVLVQLPTLAGIGARSANGYLVFGVDTRDNNRLGAANVVPVSPFNGFFTTTLNGIARNNSFMDSGSNGLFFNDPSTNSPLSTKCNTASTGFYCPVQTQNLTASIQLARTSVDVKFSIFSADSLVQSGNYAFNNLGGIFDNASFDWGLPFFFGRSVFTVIEGQRVGTLSGPFYAFTD